MRSERGAAGDFRRWIPACAGMTEGVKLECGCPVGAANAVALSRRLWNNWDRPQDAPSPTPPLQLSRERGDTLPPNDIQHREHKAQAGRNPPIIVSGGSSFAVLDHARSYSMCTAAPIYGL